MIEFDVRMTKDRKLVILHDETVDRTTNGHGAVKDKTLAVMPQNICLNVHLKGSTKLAVAAVKVLYEAGSLIICRIANFNRTKWIRLHYNLQESCELCEIKE